MGAVALEGEDAPTRVGQVLDGKFRVERILGEGSMGLVVEATHLALDERVALKFLRREAREHPEIVSRFAREARASVKIKSDHVARVFDVGTSEDGTPFIVMEYLEGSDLATVLARQERLPIGDAVDYVIQACLGLTEAHARGIVHRDIKPENLFLCQGAGALKQVKVLDFGISKAGIGPGNLDADLTSSNTTQIMGSPHYMSPDQLRSTRDVDGRADIWSLGVVLFELLAGQPPFPGDDVSALIARVLHEPHPRLSGLRPEVSAALEAVVDRCLAKAPEGRFDNAAEMAAALLPFAPKRSRATVERAMDVVQARSGSFAAYVDSIPPPSSVVSRTAASPPVSAPSPEPAVVAVTQSPPRSRLVLVVVGVVLLVGLAVAVVLLRGRSGPEPTGSGGPAGAASVGAWSALPSPVDSAASPLVPPSAATPESAPAAPAIAAPASVAPSPIAPAGPSVGAKSGAPGGGARRAAPPPARSAASPPSTARHSDSDIRLER